jgi:hypothetical protein
MTLEHNTSLQRICFESVNRYASQSLILAKYGYDLVSIPLLIASIRSSALRRLYFVHAAASALQRARGYSDAPEKLKATWSDIDGALSVFHTGRPELAQSVWIVEATSQYFGADVVWLKERLPLCDGRGFLRFIRVEVYDRSIFEHGDPCF